MRLRLHPHANAATVVSNIRHAPPSVGRWHHECVLRIHRESIKTTHGQSPLGRTAGCTRHDAGRLPQGEWAMRSAPLSALHSTSEPCLPAELEHLLLDVVADGFVLYCCGPIAAPCALVASYQWEQFVDLVTIRCFDQVTTARVPVPTHSSVDVFAPEAVVWAYEGPPRWALRALLDLVAPQHPRAPTSVYPAPPSLRIPRSDQRPMTIRFPPPDRAGMRAVRLAGREGLLPIDQATHV